MKHVTALENLTTAVLMTDLELCVHYLNPAAETLLDISADRAHGMCLEKLLPHADHLIEGLRKAARTGGAYTEREISIDFPGNRELIASCTVTPISDRGRAPGLLLELVELNRQLRMLREEHLLRQQKATQAMLRALAHEVKNPLGGLRGAAQLLQLELDDPELREYTRIIIREADRLRKLMDRILGPNSRPQIAVMCIHEVLEHVRSLLAAEAPHGVRIDHDYDPSIPFMRGDRDLLVQAALNIARNALQAVGHTGVILVRTRIARQRTFNHQRHRLAIKIDIVDDGPGIPPEMREHIFFPMITGRAEGAGLGLSIAQHLISQHEGVIECESRPGCTEFTILLPLGNGVSKTGSWSQ
ncbi:MAG: PAS domain-containing protein [Gammaproteobacteria bacterium]|nr:PAS domain-containing protein [Gammaproteobacteria bacterium]